jgi:gamma-glutamylcyclotransferase (GGCT)/AIG2-like uncharacterized protein YtfP
MRRVTFDDITWEELDSMERYALSDAVEARGEVVALTGEREDVRDYENLAQKGLLESVLIKSGRWPRFGYRITQKGYEVYEAGTKP